MSRSWVKDVYDVWSVGGDIVEMRISGLGVLQAQCTGEGFGMKEDCFLCAGR